MTLCKERLISFKLIENNLELWQNWQEQPASKRTAQISAIEEGIHAYAVEIADDSGYDKKFETVPNSLGMFTTIYSTLLNKILTNTEVNVSAKQLLDYIINDGNCHSLARMSLVELCPSANKDIRDDLESRKNVKLKKNICKIFICPKCKHNETTSKMVQKKALDEGQTQTLQCEHCLYRWDLY
jgi:DNA-directed RNA polymerase subunit M/transcription elongation factor TFIIS